jgi:hypothetical protein
MEPKLETADKPPDEPALDREPEAVYLRKRTRRLGPKRPRGAPQFENDPGWDNIIRAYEDVDTPFDN